VAVGAVAMDRNAPQACWIWLVADNLRLAAENAVAVGSQLL
jgi:aspartate-semialdehyde dehydrogenase